MLALATTILFLSYTCYLLIKLWIMVEKLEKQLKELKDNQQKMPKGMAHAINNPLAVINLSCQALTHINKDNPAMSASIVAIESSVERIEKIVKGASIDQKKAG